MSMNVTGNKGMWDLPTHRAFENIEAGKGSKSKTDQAGFRYYVMAELPEWSVKTLILKMIGTKVTIDGKECIIGKRSFTEFVTRIKNDVPELKQLANKKSLDIKACLSALQSFQNKNGSGPKTTIVAPPTASPQQATAKVLPLARLLSESKDATVQKVGQALQTFAKEASDENAAKVEAAVEQANPTALDKAGESMATTGTEKKSSNEGVSRQASGTKAMERDTQMPATERKSSQEGVMQRQNSGNAQQMDRQPSNKGVSRQNSGNAQPMERQPSNKSQNTDMPRQQSGTDAMRQPSAARMSEDDSSSASSATKAQGGAKMGKSKFSPEARQRIEKLRGKPIEWEGREQQIKLGLTEAAKKAVDGGAAKIKEFKDDLATTDYRLDIDKKGHINIKKAH